MNTEYRIRNIRTGDIVPDPIGSPGWVEPLGTGSHDENSSVAEWVVEFEGDEPGQWLASSIHQWDISGVKNPLIFREALGFLQLWD